jgi:hypothetical protein
VVANDARVDQLAAQVERLVSQLDSLANTPAPAPVAPEPTPEPVAPGDALQELAADPQGFVAKTARDEAQRLVSEAVNPTVMQVLDAASQQLVNSHALRIEQEFGAGAWDDMFKPALEADLVRLREVSPRSLADPATIEALVNRLYGGENFTKLTERKAEHAKKLGEQEQEGLQKVARLVPQGGVPRLRKGNGEAGLPEDVEKFLKEVDAATGRPQDRERFEKLYATGEDTGRTHRTDVVEYLKAVGADPETIKQHGG